MMMKEKYQIDSRQNRAFMKQMRKELLSFGKRFPSPHGASYYLGDDGTPWKDRPCETWITCRMAHVYSIGSMLDFQGAGGLADAALRGLSGVLHDDKNGGWYAGVKADGEALSGKQCYAHAFVLLAASSALLAKREGAKELLGEALALFDLRFWDEERGLTFDTWNTEFTVLDDYRGLNANMHTVEAFLAVADATGEEKYRDRAGRIIDCVIAWAKENDWRIPEHYTTDWKPDLACNRDKPDDQFKPYGATPGHGIEWARLIVQWACSSFPGDQEGRRENADLMVEPEPYTIDQAAKEKYADDRAKRNAYIEAAASLYRRAVTDAWNRDGAEGIVYTTDWNGEPVVHDRMHWTLAEALNTSAVLYRVTGDQVYADEFSAFLQYIDEKLLDHKNGSWYHQLDRHNRVLDTVWPGKPDIYHAFQAMLIPYAEADMSVAAAVRENSDWFE